MNDSTSIRPFHLAFPVRDLKETEIWYTTILGCTTGRKSDKWIDFNFFGHQVVAHLVDNIENIRGHERDLGHEYIWIQEFRSTGLHRPGFPKVSNVLLVFGEMGQMGINQSIIKFVAESTDLNDEGKRTAEYITASFIIITIVSILIIIMFHIL